MNTQPPTASAARSGRHRAARQRLGAEGLAEHREVLLAKHEQQREADPDRRDRLGRDPALTARPSVAMPRTPASEQTTTSAIPTNTIRLGVTSTPSSVSAHGAPR
jgi:hypothetical protein